VGVSTGPRLGGRPRLQAATCLQTLRRSSSGRFARRHYLIGGFFAFHRDSLEENTRLLEFQLI